MNAFGAYFVLLLLTSLLLDGGMVFRICLAGVGLHLVVSVWIMIRRFHTMSRTDYLVVSCGLVSFSTAPAFKLMDDEIKED